MGVRHTFLRTLDGAVAIKPDFRHILWLSRAISFRFGIFPCLGLRKWLKTAIFAFLLLSYIRMSILRADFHLVVGGVSYVYYSDLCRKLRVSDFAA